MVGEKRIEINNEEGGGKRATLTDSLCNREMFSGAVGSLDRAGLVSITITEETEESAGDPKLGETIPKTVMPDRVKGFSKINKSDIGVFMLDPAALESFDKGREVRKTTSMRSKTILKGGETIIFFKEKK